MRYYTLTLTPQSNAISPAQQEQALECSVPMQPTEGKNTKKPVIFSTLDSKGNNNLNALQIDIDIPVCEYDTVSGNGLIRIYGIDLELIKQATDFRGATFELTAGMSKGLPLANPEQAGVIASGSVFQAFGNWQGEQMTLDLSVQGVINYANNYAFKWSKGEKLSEMLKRVIEKNHSGYIVRIAINENLILSADETGFYSTLPRFAQYVRRVSKSIITDPDYNGVGISIRDKNIIVQDGSSKKNPVKISFIDLVGQPTWLNFGTIQFKSVLRSDLHVGDIVQLPESLYKLSSKSNQGFKKDKTAFNGVFMITQVRHIVSSRQPDANSWCTVFDCLEQAV